MTTLLLAALAALAIFVCDNSGYYLPGFIATTVGDTADDQSKLHWSTIGCPPGEYAVGVSERQGGWTAQIQLLCAQPAAGGGWTQDVAGGEAGGPHGDHVARLLCSHNAWVTGVSAQMVAAHYNDVTHEQTVHYLANPVIYCGNAANPALQTFTDPNFKPQKASGLFPTTYQDSPTAYCPAGAFLNAAQVATATFNNPDIQAIQIQCARLPAPAQAPVVPAFTGVRHP